MIIPRKMQNNMITEMQRMRYHLPKPTQGHIHIIVIQPLERRGNGVPLAV